MQDINRMWAQITAKLKSSLSDSDFYAFESTFWLIKAQGNTFVLGYNDKYVYRDFTGRNLNALDRKSTRLNSSHSGQSRMPSSA